MHKIPVLGSHRKSRNYIEFLTIFLIIMSINLMLNDDSDFSYDYRVFYLCTSI